jgi:hypothetical protein
MDTSTVQAVCALLYGLNPDWVLITGGKIWGPEPNTNVTNTIQHGCGIFDLRSGVASFDHGTSVRRPAAGVLCAAVDAGKWHSVTSVDNVRLFRYTDGYGTPITNSEHFNQYLIEITGMVRRNRNTT